MAYPVELEGLIPAFDLDGVLILNQHQLADQLITAEIEQSARELIAEQPVGPPPPQQEEEGGGLPWWGWALIGVGVVGVAASSSSDSGSSSSSSGSGGSVDFTY